MRFSEACLVTALVQATTVTARYSLYEDDSLGLETRDLEDYLDLEIRNHDEDSDVDLTEHDDDEQSSKDIVPGNPCTTFINISPGGQPYQIKRCIRADGSIQTTPLSHRSTPMSSGSLLLMAGDVPTLDPFQSMFSSWFRPQRSPLDRILREFTTPAHRGHSHMLMIPPQRHDHHHHQQDHGVVKSILTAGHSGPQGSSISTSRISTSSSTANGKGGMTCTSLLSIGMDGIPHSSKKCTTTRPQVLEENVREKVIKALRAKRILELDVPTRGEIKTFSSSGSSSKKKKKKTKKGKGNRKHHDHEHDHDHDEHKEETNKHEDEHKDSHHHHDNDDEEKHDIKRTLLNYNNNNDDDFEDLFAREAEADPDLDLDDIISSENLVARDAESELEAELEGTLVVRDATADAEPEPEPKAFPRPIAEAGADAGAVSAPEPSSLR